MPRFSHTTTQARKDLVATKRDTFLQDIATKTPVEINDFVDTNFAQLDATQRKFFKVLGLVAVQYIRDKL